MSLRRYLTLDLDQDFSAHSSKRILIGIVLMAAVLRLWGIWHGYPYSYYTDESHLVKRALSFGSGDLNPHWFHKPAFYMYILFFEYGLFYVLGKLAGIWQSANDFAVFYIKNPGPFYLIGRVTTTLFSLGSIIFTYLTAGKLFNRKVGLLAALLLTLSFGHVMVAKDIKADTPCMFFTIVSAYYLARYVKEKQTRDIFFSAIFAGIGAATKYYSLVMLVPIFFALISNLKPRNLKRIANATLLFCLCVVTFYSTFFVCAPYNFIDPLGRKFTFKLFDRLEWKVDTLAKQWKASIAKKEAVQEQKQKISTSRQKQKVMDSGPKSSNEWKVSAFSRKGVIHYLQELRKGLGVVVIVTILLSLFLIIFNLNRAFLIFLIFPVIYSVLSEFTSPGYSEIRHQVVLYPFLVVCSSLVFARILNFTATEKPLGYIVLLVLLIPLYQIVEYNIFVSKGDTRNIAKAWIEEHIPAGTKILIEEGGLKLSPGRNYYQEMLDKARAFKKSQFTVHAEKLYNLKLLALPEITYDITYIRHPWWLKREQTSGVYHASTTYDVDMGNPLKPVGIMTYDFYKKNGFKYIITTSNEYLDFREGTRDSRNFPSFYEFYKTLFLKGTLIKEFGPEINSNPGPTVKIFRVD